MNQPTINFRRRFADLISESMKHDPSIVVVTGDLGYKTWDDIRQKFPDRFFNVGASEQSLIGIGVGLALKGKKPILYSITPFLLYRPFETIRNYIHHEKIPVILVGSGRNKDYAHDGFSHWAEEDRAVLNILKNVDAYWPESCDELNSIVPKVLLSETPSYINLKR